MASKVYPLPKLYHPDFALPNVKPRNPEIESGIRGEAYLFGSSSDTSLSGLKPVSQTIPALNGEGFLFTKANSEYLRFDQDIDVSKPFTFIVDFQQDGTAGYWQSIATLNFAYQVGEGVGIIMQNATDVTLFYGSAGISMVLSLSAGRHRVAATYDGTTLKAALDGVETASITTTLTQDDTNALVIGARGSNTGESQQDFFGGTIYSVQAYQGVHGTVAELSADPYGITLKPAIPLPYFVPAAAAGGGVDELSLMLMGVGA